MSDVSGTPETAATPAPAAPNPEKRIQAEQVLGDVLRLMEIPGRLELKDAADGGISAAIFIEGDVPGLVNGKRTHLVDALQFLANKIVNRPQGEKRWISVGIGGHPEPRPPRPEKQPGAQQAQGQTAQPQQPRPPKPPREPRAPQGAVAAGPQGTAPAARGGPQQPAAPHGKPHHGGGGGKASHEPEELKAEVAEDPAVSAAAKLLAEKSVKHGRHYAVSPMKQEDRARFLKVAGAVAGVKVNAEGEGRARRVLLTPEKPVPMPKKGVMPDYDDEDEA